MRGNITWPWYRKVILLYYRKLKICLRFSCGHLSRKWHWQKIYCNSVTKIDFIYKKSTYSIPSSHDQETNILTKAFVSRRLFAPIWTITDVSLGEQTRRTWTKHKIWRPRTLLVLALRDPHFGAFLALIQRHVVPFTSRPIHCYINSNARRS